MTSARVFGLLLGALGCSRSTSPPTEARHDAAASALPTTLSPTSAAPNSASPSSAPSQAAATTGLEKLCGADGLPRIDQRSVDLPALLRAAEQHSAALAWNGSRAEVVPDCVLPGSYTEVNAQGGRLFATNRPLLRMDEVDSKCSRATHVLAAYATWSAPVGMAGILVPLPCPPTSDANAAVGCVGAGEAGKQRAERARALSKPLSAHTEGAPQVTESLTAFALAPNEAHAVEGLAHAHSGDPALSAQISWLLRQYEHRQGSPGAPSRFGLRAKGEVREPVLNWEATDMSALHQPVFMYCFLEHVRLVNTSGSGTWYPAQRKQTP